mgnify:FL=1
MAIIYTYPSTTNLNADDLFVISKANNSSTNGLPTKSISASAVAAGLIPFIPGTGSGKKDHITVWETDDTIYSVTNDTAIANKDFNVIATQSSANIKLGATDSTYNSINEGIEIYPNTTHYTTRVTPWLEVYSYEDPSLQPDNTYDASYNGSAFLMGKSNTVGSATSSNLAVIGFNNKLTGDKMLVVGQGNDIQGNNVASLIVGTTNTAGSGAGQELINSLFVGQNLVNANTVKRSAFIGINISSGLGSINNGLYTGSNHLTIAGDNNAVIGGTGNQLANGNGTVVLGGSGNGTATNNAVVFGWQNQSNNSGNSYGLLVGGRSNNLGTSNIQSSFITGRDNDISDAYATFNSIIAGNENTAPLNNSLVLGILNNSTALNPQATENTIIAGRSNTLNNVIDSIIVADTTVTSDSFGFVRSLMVGKDHTNIGAVNSLVSGINNDIDVASSVITGQNMTTTNAASVSNSFVGGISHQFNNDDEIYNNLIIGSANEVEFNGCENTILAGQNNKTTGAVNNGRTSNNIISGNNNLINLFSTSNDQNNNIITGANNRISDSKNAAVFGSNNVIGNNSTAADGYNTSHCFSAGSNNSIGTVQSATIDSPNSSFTIGRGNQVYGQVSGAIGGSNNVYGNTNGNSVAIGNGNNIGSNADPVRNAIAIGTQNNIDADYTIHIGRGLDEMATAGGEYVMVGRNNDINNDYDLSLLDCSFIVGASDQGAAANRRNAIVVTNKSTAGNESNVILPGVGKYRNYADDTAASWGGVPLYGLYHNAGEIRIRIV